MGGQRVLGRGEGDESADTGAAFDKWRNALWTSLSRFSKASTANEIVEEDYEEEEMPADDYESSDEEENGAEPLVLLYSVSH